MRDGMRSENAMSGCGSSAMLLNDDSVAPWKRACGEGAEDDADEDGGGMSAVTTATGCAVSRRRWRRSVWMDEEGGVEVDRCRTRRGRARCVLIACLCAEGASYDAEVAAFIWYC